MHNQVRVAAVVVTYNRKILMKECLDGLLAQTRRVDSIILIDNASTDGTPEFLDSLGYLSNPTIDYVRLPENTGGAGGFHYGVKRGYEQGFDWLWVMDDDAEPEKNALAILLGSIELIKDNNLGVLTQTVQNLNGSIAHSHRGYLNFKRLWPGVLQIPLKIESYKAGKPLKIDFASFVGILISKDIIHKIGFPDKRFFIHADDLDYSIRIRKSFNMYLIPKSIIIHKYDQKPQFIVKYFLGYRFKRTPIKGYIFSYFLRRNLLYVNKKYNEYKFFYVILNFISKVVESMNIIIMDGFKVKRLTILWKSFYDGLFSNFNNNIVAKISYSTGEQTRKVS
jgi:rhamnopyranosyl-N-acetylglucosaminyl-diphospho-decaprenol beta-1,3/1,4-galactofuranosyltransferase